MCDHAWLELLSLTRRPLLLLLLLSGCLSGRRLCVSATALRCLLSLWRAGGRPGRRCEEAYPVPEGTVGGVMILLQNFWGAAFLLVPIDTLGTGWQIWAVTACMATSTLVMAGFRPSYGRSEVDVRESGPSPSPPQPLSSLARSVLTPVPSVL
eukprot:COSAG01_NODE_10492_length_2152_cov_2.259440_4_plen_153_part_00